MTRSKASLRNGLSALSVLLLSTSPAAAQTIPDGFREVIFYDDFSTPLTDNWEFDLGRSYPGGPDGWGTGEIQTYTDSLANIAVDSGNLVITPLRDATGAWSSSRIEGRPENDWACPPGGRLRVEASLKLGADAEAVQAGIWPAFWALGSTYRGDYNNWPAVGEIDILESPNGMARTWHTVHCGVTPGGPCDETNGVGGNADFSRGVFHVISVEISRAAGDGDWQADSITYAVDDVTTTTVTGGDVGDATAWAALAHEPKFLIFNVAVGGGFPDAIAGAATPNEATAGGPGAALEVDASRSTVLVGLRPVAK
ncbi:related to endo-1,3-beta-glucanase [Cephalotrichum gorgonifer]|uniref:Related to endo-1,3-beta-glucanase n=1 Tax=Cephalotrichum gorgonifer TaxID=2041049 RepID=A0AAE8MT96_9PEZI|nr:related to endo-1,3-beta-glucanase [Cephalotrichum gorgonifer]